jgi:hypothetical protein
VTNQVSRLSDFPRTFCPVLGFFAARRRDPAGLRNNHRVDSISTQRLTIDVRAADLDDVWLRRGAGTGTETMSARSFDGIDWSAWHAFVLTTII